MQRGHKRESQGEVIRSAGEHYQNREYAAAYEAFKSVYDRIVTDMQRVLARNIELEAKKMAAQQGKSLAVAKENVQQMRAHAQQLTDQFEKLRQDLESKPLVRLHIKNGKPAKADPATVEESTPTTFNSASETHIGLGPSHSEPAFVSVGNDRYLKAPYATPAVGSLYAVRDKSQVERFIHIIAVSADGSFVQANILDEGKPTKQPVQLPVDSLARQAAQGWCNSLVPTNAPAQTPPQPQQPAIRPTSDGKTLRIDIQNFGRCCGAIAIANLKYNTQCIKDVADGSFRAGEYEKAFLTFEQLVIGFSSAVALGRQEIADGRRALIADKGRLSGKEVAERTAAFVRREQRIFAAERDFATILEGLRMYLHVK